MKKILIGVIIATLAIAFISSIDVGYAYIEEWYWLPPYIWYGYEYSIYHDYIIAYESGQNASLSILVENNWWGSYINITAVKIWFDWDKNYSSKEVSETNPLKLNYYETHEFTIKFTVPPITEATNVRWHSYKIIVEFTDEWGTNATWVRWWYDIYPDYKFYVFSEEQVDAFDLSYRYYAYYESYEPYYFESVEAAMLAVEASIYAEMGYTDYMRCNFTSAKNNFQTAVDLYEEAIDKEKEVGAWIQETEANATLMEAEAALNEADAMASQADAMNKQADAAMKEADAAVTQAEAATKEADAALYQSYGYLLFGIGFILVGIGIIIFGAKKSVAKQ